MHLGSGQRGGFETPPLNCEIEKLIDSSIILALLLNNYGMSAKQFESKLQNNSHAMTTSNIVQVIAGQVHKHFFGKKVFQTFFGSKNV